MADHATEDSIFIYKGGRAPQHITHARIDPSIKVIDDEAFSNNPHLISIEIHNGVEYIRLMAFHCCTSLKSVKLLGVREIAMGAFYNCQQLTDVEFGDVLECIGDDTFAYCSSLKCLTIPFGRSIGRSAFCHCTRLTELDLPESLERIGPNALSNCPSLRRIAMPLNDRLFVGNGGGLLLDSCPNLSTVILVGGIHRLIASCPLQHWKNEMKEDIRRINKILPRIAEGDKNDAVKQWAEGLCLKVDNYKRELPGYRLLREADDLLRRALFIESLVQF
mmetsp:Transcript_4822/g.8208  ORF Transcript_4822/g.8208 Transcript_4822/m.8208 type:complete len:277 (+) Transcript_4822:73-903(+)